MYSEDCIIYVKMVFIKMHQQPLIEKTTREQS